jgi:hypothetical protein
LYVLVSSLEIPLQGPGWNLISYPVQESRSIKEALISIDGSYSTVCRYQANEPGDPWKCFGAGVPAWVNDITKLEFNGVYWVYVRDAGPLTLLLKGGSSGQIRTSLDQAVSAPTPPAIYYGTVLPAPGFYPIAGMAVEARIGEHLCGHNQTIQYGGEIVYKIDVRSSSEDSACGQIGRLVSFRIGEQIVYPMAFWDDSKIWVHLLSKHAYIFLPMVMKHP